MMKRIVSLLMTLVLTFGLCTPVWATDAEIVKPVEYWTGFQTATKTSEFDSLEEALNYASRQTDKYRRVVIASDYTITQDTAIPANVYLDVISGATLTVAKGATLTVSADAKRLGVWDGGTVVNDGTILVCGTSYHNGFVMVQDGGTLDIGKLTVPDGYMLDHNRTNYFASKATFEVTFNDGTVLLTSDSTNIKGGNVKQVKLLDNMGTRGWAIDKSIGTDFTLDLNGFKIGGDGTNPNFSTLMIYTKVTIKNGVIAYSGEKNGAIDLMSGGDLTIASDVTIDGGNGYGIFTTGTSKLTVNGTVKTNAHFAIGGNGSKDAGGYIDNCDIIVNKGAKIEAPNGFGIYHPQLGTVTVNGGAISGENGVEICAGKLIINDGNITSTGANNDATGSQNAILDGAAVSIINRNYPGGVPAAEIKGGTFTASGKDALAVKAYDYTANTVAEWVNVEESVNVTGGTFSSNPTTYVHDQHYRVVKGLNGYYTVSLKTSDDGTGGSTSVVKLPGQTTNDTTTAAIKKSDIDVNKELTVSNNADKVGDEVTVTFDKAAAANIAQAAADSDDLKLTIEKKDPTAEQKEIYQSLVENKTNVAVVNMMLTVNGQPVFTADSAAGKVTVKVPYKAGLTQSDLAVYYLNDGSAEPVPFDYDAQTGIITMTLGHFSSYMITTEVHPSIKADGKGTYTKGSKKDMTFTAVNLPVGFMAEVDEKELTEGTDYIMADGKLILKGDYLQSLSKGQHTLSILSDKQTVAETSFEVLVSSSNNGGKNNNNSGNGTVEPANTGDMGVTMYAVIAALSLMGGAWGVGKKRKK